MKVLFRLLSLLPLPVLHVLGAAIGWLLWITPNERRRTALINVRRCFPELSESEVRQRARRALGHEMKTVAELPRIWLGPDRALDDLVQRFQGRDILDDALARGRGVILLPLHQGSFEGPSIVLSRTHKITGIYKPQKGALNALSATGRTRYKGELVPAQGGIVSETLVPLLQRGEITYFLPDQDPPGGRGVYAPLFGIAAHTPKLVPRLIQATGATAVFCLGERLPRGRGYVMRFFAAPPGLDDPDPQTAVEAMNRGVEACIRACPDQYWWGYKRFRRRPPGEPDFY